jgi:hypothetical protein
MTRSADAWAAVHLATGAPADEVGAARDATTAAYAPDPAS